MPMSRPRPGPVTLIALFQFCGAGLILAVVLFTLMDPERQITSRRDIQSLIIILTRHIIVPKTFIPMVMPFVAVYLAAIGWGLWNLQKWARHLLLGSSAITVVLWLKALLVRGLIMDEHILSDP